MKKQTSTNLGWNIVDVYRLLMQNIEPELLPENYKQLNKKYADESTAERKARFAHYADCFSLFLERLDTLMNLLKAHVTHEYQLLRQQIEQGADEVKDDFLASFDDFIKDA